MGSHADCVLLQFSPTNIRSRAPPASSMPPSDRLRIRANSEYSMGFIQSRDGRAENTFFVKFNENRSNAGDMLLVEHGTFQVVLWANVKACALGGCRLRCKS